MTTLASPRSDTLTWALRVLGALLLAAMAAVHAHLWQQGYDGIPVIGPSFLVNAALGLLGALALVVAARRWLPWVAAAGAALAVGSLGALIVSTTVGLFGFVESTSALLWWESFWIEAAAVVVLVALTSRAVHRHDQSPDRPTWLPGPDGPPPPRARRRRLVRVRQGPSQEPVSAATSGPGP